MFLAELKITEKLAFIQLAKEIATVDDNQIDSFEQKMLNTMLNEMQLQKDNSLSIDFDLKVLAGAFTSVQTMRICLIELYSLTLVNNNFNEKQEHLLESLAHEFAINEREFKKLKEWVDEAMEMTNTGMKLIAGEE